MHWLAEPIVRRLYQDLARLVRPGGVVAHAEVMPITDLPILGAGLARVQRERRVANGISDSNDWWDKAARDPLLRGASRERQAVLPTNYRRARLGREDTALTLWTLTEPQLFATYTSSGRSPGHYESWLADVLSRALLD